MKTSLITAACLFALMLIPAVSNAEFVIDDFSASGPAPYDFNGDAQTSSSAGPGVDDFGSNYNGITRSASGSVSADPSGFVLFPGQGSDFTLSYDFSAVGDTFSLGYYAKNFRFEGLVSTPNTSYGITIKATRGNGETDSFSLANVPLTNLGDPVYFDLTSLGNVGIINDLEKLSFTFSKATTGAAVLGFSQFALIATPEPTSIVSLGAVAVVGLVGSTRRRKR